MSDFQRKILPLADAKVSGDGTGSFSGYASLFGVKDSGGDVVMPGAYADTLSQFIERGFIAWGHDWNQPVATISAAHEDQRGLFVTADFHSDPESQIARVRTAERLQRGKFMGLSIGYGVEDEEYAQDARLLKKIHLYETSLVTVPMLAPAGVTDVKGLRLDFDTHADAVEADLKEFIARCRSGSESRVKEGRAISSARRDRMAGVSESLRVAATEIDALLEETAPPQKQAAPFDAPSLFADYQRTLAHLRGLRV